MTRKRLLIEISPNRYNAVIVRSGEVIGQCNGAARYSSDNDSLEHLLQSAKPKLMGLITAHKLSNVKATVLYSSPNTSLGVFSFPRSVGMTGAIEAATLALEEAAEYPLAKNPHQIAHLCTDPVDTNDDDSATPMIHVFGVADADSVVERLCQWIRECGQNIEAVVPTKTIAMLAAVEAAMTPPSSHTRIILHMSDDSAVLAAARDGTLTFVRSIGAGASALVNAIAGNAKATRPDGTTEPLTRSEAASLLFEHGIPESGSELDPALGIQANDILPLLQPILQRCVIQTKQSLRFGLSRDERERAMLAVTGVGSHIPGLADLIAQQADIKLDQDVPIKEGTGCALCSYMTFDTPPPQLVSVRVRTQRQLRRLQVAMGIGLTAAVLLLGADAINTHQATKQSQRETLALESRMNTDRPVQQASQRLAQSVGLLARADKALADVTRGQAKWDAVLALLSETASDQITLSRISMNREEGSPLCSLSGEVRADSEQAARNAFTSLVEALSQSPIVVRCSIASTTKDRSDPGVQRFELRLTLRESARSTFALADDTPHIEPVAGGNQ